MEAQLLAGGDELGDRRAVGARAVGGYGEAELPVK